MSAIQIRRADDRFRTDQDGAVMMQTDGRSLRVRTFRGQDVTFGAAARPVPTVSPRPPGHGVADAVASWVTSTWKRVPARHHKDHEEHEGH